MADAKISALADGSPISAADLLVVARSGGNFKVRPPSLAELAAVSPAAAAIAANGQKITGLGTPTAAGDAATKGYVDTQVVAGAAAPLASVLAAGNDAGALLIANLGDPVAQQDAATKDYVDTLIFNNIPGTSYTLALTDIGKIVDFVGASASVLTIPTFASVAFPSGTQILVRQGGGQVTIQGAAGVTLSNPYNSFTLAGQGAEVRLLKIGTNAWSVNGEVV